MRTRHLLATLFLSITLLAGAASAETLAGYVTSVDAYARTGTFNSWRSGGWMQVRLALRNHPTIPNGTVVTVVIARFPAGTPVPDDVASLMIAAVATPGRYVTFYDVTWFATNAYYTHAGSRLDITGLASVQVTGNHTGTLRRIELFDGDDRYGNVHVLTPTGVVELPLSRLGTLEHTRHVVATLAQPWRTLNISRLGPGWGIDDSTWITGSY
jgi:hypothetical protein